MKKVFISVLIVLVAVLYTVALLISLFSKIEKDDAMAVADQLFEYIEKGDYASASELFCANEDDDKSFSEFLDEVEIETGLDFQSNVEILEYSEYHSGPNSYFGVVSADFNVKAIVDGKEMTIHVGVLENEEKIECYQLVIYTDDNEYKEFSCHYID